jgi:hypothetical protein
VASVGNSAHAIRSRHLQCAHSDRVGVAVLGGRRHELKRMLQHARVVNHDTTALAMPRPAPESSMKCRCLLLTWEGWEVRRQFITH